jgi:hypothetical protein
MPGLRRWAFPLIDGKRPERYRAEHRVQLVESKPLTAAEDHLATDGVGMSSVGEAE